MELHLYRCWKNAFLSFQDRKNESTPKFPSVQELDLSGQNNTYECMFHTLAKVS